MNHGTNDDDLLATVTAFAESMFAKARALRRESLPPAMRARLRESISDDIKKVGTFCAPEASEAALAVARALHVDLFTSNWHDQVRFDPGRTRFHLEHVEPVSAIREACCAAADVAGVLHVLQTRLRVAWILKEEDRRLTATGHRSKRPDPEAAYRAANITLVTRATVRACIR
jgi:hypothetical protein